MVLLLVSIPVIWKSVRITMKADILATTHNPCIYVGFAKGLLTHMYFVSVGILVVKEQPSVSVERS